MKKIVILALHLGAGGVENVICNVANMLCNDYEVEIISTYKLSEKPFFYLNDKVKVSYLIKDLKPNQKEFRSAFMSLNVISIVKEAYKGIKILYLKKHLMVNAIKNINADVVISTRIIHNTWLGKYGKKEIIKIAQEHNHYNGNLKYANKVVNSLKNIDYFMPVSNELKDFYSKRISNKKTKVLYIPNALDIFPDKISELKGKNIISVGRLSHEKGFEDLIDLYKMISMKYPSWHLNIVGDGRLLNKLQAQIKEKNLESVVTLTGFKNKEELSELYLKSSIYVMTSYTESFGIVLVEAESFGIPLIAFEDAGGPKEIIINNENGFLIKNRDKNDMVEKIIMLIENSDLRHKLGKSGRNMSNSFAKDNVQKLWLDFIKQTLKKKEENLK